MFRKLFLTFFLSMILAGAAASGTATPVLVVMGILIFFVISVSTNRNATKDEKT